MSQEKVDRYKEEKAGRKETLKKQKRLRAVRTTLVSVVLIVIVGWLGYSVYGVHEAKQPRTVTEVDYSAVDEYMQSLN